MNLKRTETRVLELTRKHGVAQKNVMGAYTSRPSRQVEFLLHEVAHWTTLGHSLKKLPRRLSKQIGDRFNNMSPTVANALEIDTSMVTYLAGRLLGYWDDPGPIVSSCRRNLSGIISLGDDDVVYKAFVKLWQEKRSLYEVRAIELAHWLHPSARLSFPGTEFP